MLGERGEESHTLGIRVRSRSLPGYRGVTICISRTALELETEAPLDLGSEMLLDLEFGRQDLADFSAPAKVIWSDPQKRGSARSGLRFIPQSSEDSCNLARMATVLKVRSESDLQDLLEESSRIDIPQSRPPQKAPAAPPTPATDSRNLGVYIPLRTVLEGYRWLRQLDGVEVIFREETKVHTLFFPNCRRLTDHFCGAHPYVTAMFVTVTSEAIRSVQDSVGGCGWKHYRLVAERHLSILDIVSRGVEPSSDEPCVFL